MRVVPEPHRYAVCAPEGTSIKEFYRGVFEEVYIFFHPFIRPMTMDFKRFYSDDNFPDRNEIRNHCEAVSWKEYLTLSHIQDVRKLDIGLRTHILGLKKEYEDKVSAKTIEETNDKHRIAEPTEGSFPDIIMNNLLKGIQDLGHDWIWVGDEFCMERKLEYIEDILQDNNMLDNGKNLFTHDSSLLVTTHWDSHFSMLCSNRKNVQQLVEQCHLEGFYCGEGTEIYWSIRNK